MCITSFWKHALMKKRKNLSQLKGPLSFIKCWIGCLFQIQHNMVHFSMFLASKAIFVSKLTDFKSEDSNSSQSAFWCNHHICLFCLCLSPRFVYKPKMPGNHNIEESVIAFQWLSEKKRLVLCLIRNISGVEVCARIELHSCIGFCRIPLQGLSQRPVYPSFGRVIPFVDG